MAGSVNRAKPSTQVSVGELRRLGRNQQGYRGETIDIAAEIRRCRTAAASHGWAVEELTDAPTLTLPAFHRCSTCPNSPAVRVYLSAGIHGDEPAGPLAVRQLLEKNLWPAELDLWVCPCLNPTGFEVNRRENAEGTDLNRQYLQPAAREIIAHVAWLQRQPRFDLCLCLHEDWESEGFYLYELNPDGLPSIAREIVSEAAKVCPIDHSGVIDGRPAHEGIINPEVDPLLRRDWPEAFFLLMHKTRLSYTLEAPSDFPLEVRVSALLMAVQAALENAGSLLPQARGSYPSSQERGFFRPSLLRGTL